MSGQNSQMKKLAESIDKSLKDCMSTMIPLDLEHVKNDWESPKDKSQNKFEVISIISLNGDIRGVLSIHTNHKLAETITKTLLGMDSIENKEEVYDCMGEMGNIVAGGLKTEAAFDNVNFSISCPTVIRGEKFAVSEPLKNSDVCWLHYKIKDQDLLIGLQVVKS